MHLSKRVTWILRAAILAIGIFAIVSCPTMGFNSGEGISIRSFADISRVVAALSGDSSLHERQRVVSVEQADERLRSENHLDLLADFLCQLSAALPNDSFRSYYFYLAGLAYESLKQTQLQQFYLERSLHSGPDVMVEGKSIHFLSIEKLLEMQIDAELKIELYQELFDKFSDSIDRGASWYALARAYEQAGRYEDSFAAYRKFQNFPQTIIPGRSDEQRRIKELLEFARSPRDWTRGSLDQLVQEVRVALASKDVSKILSLRAKANFFSSSWQQDKTDYNSTAYWDLGRFIETAPAIYADNALEEGSNSQEAYLRTWGWNPYIPIWYLFFRRVDFPADPTVNGNWEWAGIYFGEYR